MTTKSDVEKSEPDFYRKLAEAREQSYSTDELEHRAKLAAKIVGDIEIIRTVDLDELSRRLASLATAVRLIGDAVRELEKAG